MERSRRTDGSDVDYGSIGRGYASYRQPDRRIMAHIDRALGPARKVLNVGAGTGSYEPVDRDVTAVEPSASMRAQRPSHVSVAIDAVAEDLPFGDRQFDASMATFRGASLSSSRSHSRGARGIGPGAQRAHSVRLL